MLIRYAIVAVFCIGLGLAPFNAEPHLLGKLRWVSGGAIGMRFVDWIDLIMHGGPFVALISMIIYDGVQLIRARANPEAP
ncbi:MAG: hypothetical protein AB8H79_06800 [Myxococcota bacterium]